MQLPGLGRINYFSNLRWSALRFDGLTSDVRDAEAPLSLETFEKLMTDTYPKKTYLGTLPQSVKASLKEANAREFLKFLDQAATTLRAGTTPRFLRNLLWPKSVQVPLQNQTIDFNLAGSGSSGGVYRFKLGDTDYALKIFDEPNKKQRFFKRHGTHWETLIGLTLSKHAFKDLSQFHLANPRLGWILYEWVYDGMELEKRPGISLKDCNLYVKDDLAYVNSKPGKNGGYIRFDHGGIEAIPNQRLLRSDTRPLPEPTPEPDRNVKSLLMDLLHQISPF